MTGLRVLVHLDETVPLQPCQIFGPLLPQCTRIDCCDRVGHFTTTWASHPLPAGRRHAAARPSYRRPSRTSLKGPQMHHSRGYRRPLDCLVSESDRYHDGP
jgi:hypothetical protein